MRAPIRQVSTRKVRTLSTHQAKFATPQAAFRSGLEERIAEQLRRAGQRVRFEERTLSYTIPQSVHRYTPDFELDNGIIVESKGLFSGDDRKKMRLVKEQHPHLDIRFVFSNAQARISKQSKTTYAKWADTYGFKWAHKEVPACWLTEPPTAKKENA